jgi:hypothetical protein
MQTMYGMQQTNLVQFYLQKTQQKIEERQRKTEEDTKRWFIECNQKEEFTNYAKFVSALRQSMYPSQIIPADDFKKILNLGNYSEKGNSGMIF